MAVLQADGNYDLEEGNNIGDEGDMWLPGMKLTPNNDGKTYPNSDSYQKGKIKKSGVTVEVLEAIGQNFKLQITLGSRSGGDSSETFSAPVKEEDHSDAQEQFRVPDSVGVQISGKIPQLPWREEFLEGAASSARAMTGWGHYGWTTMVAIFPIILGGLMVL